MREKAKPDGGDIVRGGSLMHSAEPDFSGYVTKAGLLCADGRTIMPDAFKHQDQQTVPLVWQHNHDEPENVLGHVLLENRDDGVYGYAYLNGSDRAANAKQLVEHKDISQFSIYANKLNEKAKKVIHGMIREVSLVLAGANPGALIDNITLAHGNGEYVELEDEAVITTGEELEIEHAEGEDKETGPSIQEVYDGMSDVEKEVVHYMVGQALEEAKVEHSSTGALPPKEPTHKEEGTRRMSRNVFEQQNGSKEGEGEQHVLTHDAVKSIVEDGKRRGKLSEAVEAYALEHGIENLEILFPDAKAITETPEFDARRVEWVSGVLNAIKKTPFSRIKSLTADLTHDEARARGYIKGNFKKEEFFALSKRVTTPTTVYKKQKLDRDDIIDITTLDVVAWLKGEMRLMMDEELAIVALIGDGRAVDDEDKIKDPAGAVEGAGIRSILNDHDLYAATVTVESDFAGTNQADVIDRLLLNMQHYKGSGSPTLYTTLPKLTWLLLARDGMGRRMYRTASDLASELGVANIVTVEAMEREPDVVGIIVNLKDYTFGADRGGDLAFFDDFDIDYNQYKYLLETRVSGALTKIRSALVIRRVDESETLVDPASPTFDGEAITIVDTAGVEYRRTDTDAVVTAAGSPYAVAEGTSLTIEATPTAGNYFENNVEDEWTFTNEA